MSAGMSLTPAEQRAIQLARKGLIGADALLHSIAQPQAQPARQPPQPLAAHLSQFSLQPPSVDGQQEADLPPNRTRLGLLKSHARRRSESHIPRPRNAFILFRSDAISDPSFSSTHEPQGGLDNAEKSRLLGRLWRDLPEVERAKWERLAEREKEEHARRYPGYKYKPKPKKGATLATTSPSKPTPARSKTAPTPSSAVAAKETIAITRPRRSTRAKTSFGFSSDDDSDGQSDPGQAGDDPTYLASDEESESGGVGRQRKWRRRGGVVALHPQEEGKDLVVAELPPVPQQQHVELTPPGGMKHSRLAYRRRSSGTQPTAAYVPSPSAPALAPATPTPAARPGAEQLRRSQSPSKAAKKEAYKALSRSVPASGGYAYHQQPEQGQGQGQYYSPPIAQQQQQYREEDDGLLYHGQGHQYLPSPSPGPRHHPSHQQQHHDSHRRVQQQYDQSTPTHYYTSSPERRGQAGYYQQQQALPQQQDEWEGVGLGIDWGEGGGYYPDAATVAMEYHHPHSHHHQQGAMPAAIDHAHAPPLSRGVAPSRSSFSNVRSGGHGQERYEPVPPPAPTTGVFPQYAYTRPPSAYQGQQPQNQQQRFASSAYEFYPSPALSPVAPAGTGRGAGLAPPQQQQQHVQHQVQGQEEDGQYLSSSSLDRDRDREREAQYGHALRRKQVQLNDAEEETLLPRGDDRKFSYSPWNLVPPSQVQQRTRMPSTWSPPPALDDPAYKFGGTYDSDDPLTAAAPYAVDGSGEAHHEDGGPKSPLDTFGGALQRETRRVASTVLLSGGLPPSQFSASIPEQHEEEKEAEEPPSASLAMSKSWSNPLPLTGGTAYSATSLAYEPTSPSSLSASFVPLAGSATTTGNTITVDPTKVEMEKWRALDGGGQQEQEQEMMPDFHFGLEGMFELPPAALHSTPAQYQHHHSNDRFDWGEHRPGSPFSAPTVFGREEMDDVLSMAAWSDAGIVALPGQQSQQRAPPPQQQTRGGRGSPYKRGGGSIMIPLNDDEDGGKKRTSVVANAALKRSTRGVGGA